MKYGVQGIGWTYVFYLVILGWGVVIVALFLKQVDAAEQPSALKLIREKCLKCHSGEKPEGGLRVDTVDNMVRGGKHGPVLVPFKPDESLIYKALIGADNAVRMPPFYPLEEDEVATIRRWIYRGAQQFSMSGQEP